MSKKTRLENLYSVAVARDATALRYNPAESYQYSIDLRAILMEIRKAHPHTFSHNPQEIDHILTAFFSKPSNDLVMKFFTDPRILEYICSMYDDFKKEKDEELKEKAFLPGGAINTVKHEDYEAAVDIVDEFVEMGLDTLDESQLEIYEENLDFVKKYEGS